MLFENIAILDKNFNYIKDVYVATKGDTIAYIDTVAPQENYGEKYDGRDKLMMSGMFNAHGHSIMTLLRGYAENLPLQKWLQEKVWPFEGNIDSAAASAATYLSIAEMLRFGTVSFSDMYVFDDERAGAILDSGIKANLSHGILAFDPNVEYKDVPGYDGVCNLIKNYNGAGDGRILVDVGPHAEYDTSQKAIVGMIEQAHEHNLGVQIHVSETKAEHDECCRRHDGKTPTQYLESLGLFDLPTTAAHCVWATNADLEILKNHNATIATCPASNLKLGSGIANTLKFKNSGANLAIGTDGASSNNALNLFRDMYLAAIAHKGAAEDPVGIETTDVLKAATLGGAISQRRTNSGSLEVGKKADLIVLDTDVPWLNPVTNMACNIVYSATGAEVVLTMVDGKVLYKNGEYLTIDVEKAIFETKQGRDRIAGKVIS